MGFVRNPIRCRVSIVAMGWKADGSSKTLKGDAQFGTTYTVAVTKVGYRIALKAVKKTCLRRCFYFMVFGRPPLNDRVSRDDVTLYFFIFFYSDTVWGQTHALSCVNGFLHTRIFYTVVLWYSRKTANSFFCLDHWGVFYKQKLCHTLLKQENVQSATELYLQPLRSQIKCSNE